MSNTANECLKIYIGSTGLDGTLNERDIEDQIAPDLSGIEYVVDAHLKKDAIDAMLQNVAILYADDLKDFVEDGATGELDQTNVQAAQLADGKSFNFNRAGEVVGRLPATLQGRYAADAGADDYIIHEDVATYVDHEGDALETANVHVAFNTNSDSDYNNKNIIAGALPRAISRQIPLTTGDENLMRILVKDAGFRNMVQFALNGANDDDGSNKKLQDLMNSSDAGQADDKMTLDDALKSDDASPNAPNERTTLGHEILLNIFNSNAPNPTNHVAGNADNVWSIEGADDKDYLRLNSNRQDLVAPVCLQFVLETEFKINLSNQNADPIKTDPSPAGPNNTVKILYNMIFDRDGDSQMNLDGVTYDYDAGAFEVDIENMPPAN